MLRKFEKGKSYIFDLSAYMEDLECDLQTAINLKGKLANKLVKPIGGNLGRIGEELVSVNWCKEV